VSKKTVFFIVSILQFTHNKKTLFLLCLLHFKQLSDGDALGTNENISEEQILSQITVLNQDFRRMLGTNGYNENPVGADIQVEFCLAQRDPDGFASNGITRHNIGNDFGFSMEEVEALIKPQTQWDPEQYLNIWTVNYMYLGFGQLLG